MRHCPNCGGEVVVWDKDLQADKCVDCGESWTLEEQAHEIVTAHQHPRESVTVDGTTHYAKRVVLHDTWCDSLDAFYGLPCNCSMRRK